MDNFKKILDFAQVSKMGPIKLLGGEPTTHPLFLDFMKELMHRKIAFTLISNLLYEDPKIQESIINAISARSLLSILANTSELNEKTTPIFKNNYDELAKLARTNIAFSLSSAITISRHKSPEEELAYITWLTDTFDIHQQRLAHDMLGNNEDDLFFINNTTYGNKVLAMIRHFLSREIPVSWDCKMYPCIFKDAFTAHRKIKQLISKVDFTCHGCPLDVFPNLEYIHCYPASKLRGKNLLQFATAQEAVKDLLFRKKVLLAELPRPSECLACPYFKSGECESICLGCSSIPETSLSLSDYTL